MKAVVRRVDGAVSIGLYVVGSVKSQYKCLVLAVAGVASGVPMATVVAEVIV